MDQSVQMKGQETGYDATGSYWVVGIVKVLAGQVWFLRDDKIVRPETDLFVLAMPKHSVVVPVLKNAVTLNSAMFSQVPITQIDLREPVIFCVEDASPFRTLTDVEKTLSRAKTVLPVQRVSRPNAKSRRLMKHLSEHFRESTPLPELAKKFGLAPSVMSRTFRKDWGKPPVHFRNYLRVLDAFRLLAEDSAVTDVAFDVGFNDLSRFMKQFKQTTGYSPHSIQKRSKNAK